MRQVGKEGAMICALVVLSGMSLLMIQIMIEDTRILWRDTKRQVESDFGHDTKIYPDYSHE